MPSALLRRRTALRQEETASALSSKCSCILPRWVSNLDCSLQKSKESPPRGPALRGREAAEPVIESRCGLPAITCSANPCRQHPELRPLQTERFADLLLRCQAYHEPTFFIHRPTGIAVMTTDRGPDGSCKGPSVARECPTSPPEVPPRDGNPPLVRSRGYAFLAHVHVVAEAGQALRVCVHRSGGYQRDALLRFSPPT